MSVSGSKLFQIALVAILVLMSTFVVAGSGDFETIKDEVDDFELSEQTVEYFKIDQIDTEYIKESLKQVEDPTEKDLEDVRSVVENDKYWEKANVSKSYKRYLDPSLEDIDPESLEVMRDELETHKHIFASDRSVENLDNSLKSDQETVEGSYIVEYDTAGYSTQGVSGIEDMHDSVEKAINSVSDVSASGASSGPEMRHRYGELFEGSNIRGVKKEHLDQVKKLPFVERVVPDRKVSVNVGDAREIVNATGLKDGSGNNLTGKNVRIAIVDTGVDYTHEALGNCTSIDSGSCDKFVLGKDMVDSDGDPMDENGHGTHVAGIAAGNGGDIKGVAPESKIMAYRVLGSGGSGSSADIIDAVEHAASNDADIISLSLGGTGTPDSPLSQTVDDAMDDGSLPVVAAGNEGEIDTVGSPGAARDVLTVGATRKDNENRVTDFSSQGPEIWFDSGSDSYRAISKPDIVAPGFNITSSIPGNKYTELNGTSMATPVVSGAAALLVQEKDHSFQPEQLRNDLVSSTGYETDNRPWAHGSGLADADAAVNEKEPRIANYSLDFEYVDSGQKNTQKLVVENPASQSLNLDLQVVDEHKYAPGDNSMDPYTDSAFNLSETSFSLDAGKNKSVTIEVETDETGVYQSYVELSEGGDVKDARPVTTVVDSVGTSTQIALNVTEDGEQRFQYGSPMISDLYYLDGAGDIIKKEEIYFGAPPPQEVAERMGVNLLIETLKDTDGFEGDGEKVIAELENSSQDFGSFQDVREFVRNSSTIGGDREDNLLQFINNTEETLEDVESSMDGNIQDVNESVNADSYLYVGANSPGIWNVMTNSTDSFFYAERFTLAEGGIKVVDVEMDGMKSVTLQNEYNSEDLFLESTAIGYNVTGDYGSHARNGFPVEAYTGSHEIKYGFENTSKTIDWGYGAQSRDTDAGWEKGEELGFEEAIDDHINSTDSYVGFWEFTDGPGNGTVIGYDNSTLNTKSFSNQGLYQPENIPVLFENLEYEGQTNLELPLFHAMAYPETAKLHLPDTENLDYQKVSVFHAPNIPPLGMSEVIDDQGEVGGYPLEPPTVGWNGDNLTVEGGIGHESSLRPGLGGIPGSNGMEINVTNSTGSKIVSVEESRSWRNITETAGDVDSVEILFSKDTPLQSETEISANVKAQGKMPGITGFSNYDEKLDGWSMTVSHNGDSATGYVKNSLGEWNETESVNGGDVSLSITDIDSGLQPNASLDARVQVENSTAEVNYTFKNISKSEEALIFSEETEDENNISVKVGRETGLEDAQISNFMLESDINGSTETDLSFGEAEFDRASCQLEEQQVSLNGTQDYLFYNASEEVDKYEPVEDYFSDVLPGQDLEIEVSAPNGCGDVNYTLRRGSSKDLAGATEIDKGPTDNGSVEFQVDTEDKSSQDWIYFEVYAESGEKNVTSETKSVNVTDDVKEANDVFIGLRESSGEDITGIQASVTDWLTLEDMSPPGNHIEITEIGQGGFELGDGDLSLDQGDHLVSYKLPENDSWVEISSDGKAEHVEYIREYSFPPETREVNLTDGKDITLNIPDGYGVSGSDEVNISLRRFDRRSPYDRIPYLYMPPERQKTVDSSMGEVVFENVSDGGYTLEVDSHDYQIQNQNPLQPTLSPGDKKNVTLTDKTENITANISEDDRDARYAVLARGDEGEFLEVSRDPGLVNLSVASESTDLYDLEVLRFETDWKRIENIDREVNRSVNVTDADNVDFEFSSPIKINGTVRDENNDTLRYGDAMVVFESANGIGTASSETDYNGVYQVNLDQNTTYNVRVFWDGKDYRDTITTNGTDDQLDINLTKGETLQVDWEQGEPAVHTELRLINDSEEYYRGESVEADSEWTVKFKGLSKDTGYDLLVRPEGEEYGQKTIEIGENKRSKTIGLDKVNDIEVNGTVSNTEATVRFRNVETGKEKTVETSNNDYSIEMKPGRYMIRVEPDDSQYERVSERRRLLENKSNLDFSPPGRKIYSANLTNGTHGVSDAEVFAWSSDARHEDFDTTDEDGNFSLELVEDANYRVSIEHPDYRPEELSGTANGLNSSNGTVQLSEGNVMQRTVKSNGKNVSGGVVYVRNESEKSYGSDQINSTGGFKITGLADVNHKVWVRPDNRSLQAKEIQLKPSNKNNIIDVSPKEGQKIEVEVLDTSDDPIEDAKVLTPETVAETDWNGEVLLDRHSTGTINIDVRADGYEGKSRSVDINAPGPYTSDVKELTSPFRLEETAEVNAEFNITNTSNNNKPVSDVSVAVSSSGEVSDSSNDVTGSTGIAEVEDISPVNYTVSVAFGEDDVYWEDNVDLSLDETGTLSNLEDSGNNPLTGYDVSYEVVPN